MGIKPLDWLRDAIDDDRLTTTQRAAVAAITRRAPGQAQRKRFAGQETGWDFYLSRNELAGLMAASVPTAERCLSRLEELGYLEKVAQGGRRGRGQHAQTLANVWRLATPQASSNSSPVRGSSGFQPITSDDMETVSNPSREHLPTHHGGVFQPITGDGPREHSYQESTVHQESTADAQRLTPLVVSDEPISWVGGKRPTQVSKSGTERAHVSSWTDEPHEVWR